MLEMQERLIGHSYEFPVFEHGTAWDNLVLKMITVMPLSKMIIHAKVLDLKKLRFIV